MKIALSILLAYLLGSLSPSALFGKLKNKNLKEEGTKNYGASNTLIVIGKGYGAAVMLLDILKGFLAVKLAFLICPQVDYIGVLAGIMAILGHIFPFYLKFNGGKGLAAFGGLVLGLSPKLFLMLLILTFILIIIINHSAAMPFTAGILFPILYYFQTQNILLGILAFVASVIIMITHFCNLRKAFTGEDMKIRDIIKSYVLKK